MRRPAGSFELVTTFGCGVDGVAARRPFTRCHAPAVQDELERDTSRVRRADQRVDALLALAQAPQTFGLHLYARLTPRAPGPAKAGHYHEDGARTSRGTPLNGSVRLQPDHGITARATLAAT